jgi:D-lactate dehydrogenase
MDIVVFDAEKWERQPFQRLEDGARVTFEEETLSASSAARHKDAEIISIDIYSHASGEVLALFPRLRMITTRSTGFDHIDLNYCGEFGITVSNIPSYGDNTVAEHVFALLLTISHHMVESVERTRRGDFSSQGLRGFDLEGKAMGVIGTGNIGRCVIRIAKGFGMEVLAFDLRPDRRLEESLGFRYTELDTLLSYSDVVTLHVPATPSTENFISEAQFDRMKDGVVFINTARGSVMNVQALVKALASGKVAAAGLDVLPEEPVIREEAELLRAVYRRQNDLEALLADCALLLLRNVFITPHNAFNTREAVQRILDATVDNIQSFMRGEPKNVIARPRETVSPQR